MHGQQALEQDGSEPHRLNPGEQPGKKGESHPPVETSVPVHPSPEAGEGPVPALRRERLPFLVSVERGLRFEEHRRGHHEQPAPDRPQDEGKDGIRHQPPANRTPDRSFPVHGAILEHPPPSAKISDLPRLSVHERPPCALPIERCDPDGMGLDEVQTVYETALGRLKADLAGATSITPSVVVDFTDPDEYQYAFVDPDGSEHRTMLALVEDIEAATVQLAGPFQEDVLEMLWGPASPSCPGHVHPPEPQLLDGMAVWRCPTTEAVVGRIGSLAE
jgi:hypothetical protein